MLSKVQNEVSDLKDKSTRINRKTLVYEEAGLSLCKVIEPQARELKWSFCVEANKQEFRHRAREQREASGAVGESF